ncbi:NusA-like transcription termination signal-binding factor [Candidatus Woesearchaeota archaeon]|nr:NusA-like transcription termination signal-binding factor [Candidatus Woesearchaeota archaeon]
MAPRIKYDLAMMKYITLFESMSGAQVKDAVEDSGVLIFIVGEHQIAKAIGKGGSTVKRLEQLTKKKAKIVEFNADITEFIRNYISPVEASEITNEDGLLTIHGRDMKSKSILIGRERRNLNLLKSILERHFEVKDVRVV